MSVGAYAEIDRLDGTVLAKYVSDFENNRFAGDGEFHPLGDYVNVDVTVGYRFGPEKNTRVYGAVRNALDDEYSTVVGYPDYGVRYYAGVQHTF